jgi:hypothetical protein
MTLARPRNKLHIARALRYDHPVSRWGWAPAPSWQFDPAAVRGRLKQWDFYGLSAPGVFVGLVVARVGRVGLAAIQWIDLATGAKVIERARVLGRAQLPATSERGDTRYEFRSTHVEVRRGADGSRAIDAHFGDLELHAVLAPAQGIAVMTPLGGGRGFYYNHKIPALPARGSIARDGTRATLDGFATLDWGRGVWPYRTSWRWAVAHGRLADGRAIGFTLGDVSADPGAPREDAMILDGELVKLDAVTFSFDRAHPMRPWRVRSAQLDLELAPRVDNSRTIQLVLASSKLVSAIGAWRGTVRTARETIAIDQLAGWAEEHLARW